MRSRRRPGVATRTSTPIESIALLLADRDAAEHHRGREPAGGGHRCGSCRRSGSASSRVGLSTRTRQPLRTARAACSARRCRIGSAKAAVLPVPVWAMPQRSRPAITCGMAWAWIGVGLLIALGGKRLQDRLGEAEIGKRVSKCVSFEQDAGSRSNASCGQSSRKTGAAAALVTTRVMGQSSGEAIEEGDRASALGRISVTQPHSSGSR